MFGIKCRLDARSVLPGNGNAREKPFFRPEGRVRNKKPNTSRREYARHFHVVRIPSKRSDRCGGEKNAIRFKRVPTIMFFLRPESIGFFVPPDRFGHAARPHG